MPSPIRAGSLPQESRLLFLTDSAEGVAFEKSAPGRNKTKAARACGKAQWLVNPQIHLTKKKSATARSWNLDLIPQTWDCSVLVFFPIEPLASDSSYVLGLLQKRKHRL